MTDENTALFVYKPTLAAKLVGTGLWAGQEWPLGAGTFTVGRDPNCDLVLSNEPGVSKTHCKITLEDNQFVLVDAESKNGTLVNRITIKRTELKSGDEIRICNVRLRFEQDLNLDVPPHSLTDQPTAVQDGLAAQDVFPSKGHTAEIQRPKTGQYGIPQLASDDFNTQPVKKKVATWPYFLLGMFSFYGVAAGLAFLNFQYGRQTPPAHSSQVSPPKTPGTSKPNLAKPGPVGTDAPKPAPALKPEDAPPTHTTENPPTPTPPPVDKPAAKDTRPLLADGTFRLQGSAGLESRVVTHTASAAVAQVWVTEGQAVKRNRTLLTYAGENTARRELEEATASVLELRNILKSQDSERVRTALAQNIKAQATAQQTLSRLRLMAPMDGVVKGLKVTAKQNVNRGEEALTLVSPSEGSSATVETLVSGSARIPVGTRLVVKLEGQSVPATVVRTDPSGSEVRLTLDIPSAPKGWKNGARVQVEIPASTPQ